MKNAIKDFAPVLLIILVIYALAFFGLRFLENQTANRIVLKTNAWECTQMPADPSSLECSQWTLKENTLRPDNKPRSAPAKR